jgi:hypothetical protein
MRRQLKAGKVAIEIEVEDGRWGKLVLQTERGSQALGRDSNDLVLSRLLGGLTRRAEWPEIPPGALYEPKWTAFSWKHVLSLCEGHTSLYGARSGQVYCIVVEDEDGKEMNRLVISETEALQWMASLAEWLKEYKSSR